MPWLELKFECDRRQSDLLSQLLSETGALAVTLTDAGDTPVYEPDPGAVPTWPCTRVTGLFPADAPLSDVMTALRARFQPGLLPECVVDALEDRAWERTCLEGLGPRRYGERLWLVPSWAGPEAAQEWDESAVIVRLDPGLAFGTGTHPTTALCLEWLDREASSGDGLTGRTVVDYGCGSGVLAIASVELGALRAHAVDTDLQALTATRDNAARNSVAAVTTHRPEALPEITADLVVSNILSGTLIELAPVLAGSCRPAGVLVLSGILCEEVPALTRAFAPWTESCTVMDREGWALVELVRNRFTG